MAQYFGPPLLWCFVQVDDELWNWTLVVPFVSVGLSVGHAALVFWKRVKLFSEIV